MTLDTTIYVLGPVDAEELFAWGNENLIRPDHEPKVIRHVPGDQFYGDVKYIDYKVGNRIGQGFDAIFEISHMNGEAIDPKVDYLAGLDGEEPDEDELAYYSKMPIHYAEIGFDTSYGYSQISENGLTIGCSALHSAYIAMLAAHLNAQGIDIEWVNEFTGDHYRNTDGLATLMQSGADAEDWFQNLALPAIKAHVESEGGTLS